MIDTCYISDKAVKLENQWLFIESYLLFIGLRSVRINHIQAPPLFIGLTMSFNPSAPPLVSETLLKSRRTLDELSHRRSITVKVQNKVPKLS